MKIKSIGLLCASSLASLLPLYANAQTPVQEDFNSNSTKSPWTALNGACLTASTLYTTGTVPAGTIPGCVAGPGVPNLYYGDVVANSAALSKPVGSQTGTTPLPDTPSSGSGATAVNGTGALRLTNGDTTSNGSNGNNETGAIISTQAFPSKNGLQITFNTVTYGGNAYNNGTSNSGADGISFFLADAGASASTTTSGTTTTTTYPSMALGSFGGSLGYDCSSAKTPADGMVGAYIGLGIDEFGNFANKTDNGNPNDPNAYSSKQPNTISIRGAGNINTAMVTALNASIPSPAVTSTTAPTSGLVYSYSTSGKKTITTTTTTTTVTTSTSTTTNYSVKTTTVSALCKSPTYTIVATPTVVTTTAAQVNGGAATTSRQTTTGTTTTTTQTVMDYPFITSSALLAGDNIYSQEANGSNPARLSAKPISYSLTLTSDGYLSVSYSYNGGVFTPVIKHQNITGTSTATNAVNNGTIPTNFLYGFAAGTGGGSNIHEITCFRAATNTDAAGSAAGNVPQNAKVKSGDGTQIYLASYNPTYWTGSLTASGLTVNSTTGVVSINPLANWDASCTLTGTANMPAGVSTLAGTCPTTGISWPAQGYSNRAIATWNDSANVAEAFTYSALQKAKQASIMDAGPYTVTPIDNLGSTRVPYLRGDQSNENGANATFRIRNSILGDIINSSPVWVGLPSSPYAQNWLDLLYPSAPAPNEAAAAIPYGSFQSISRLNVVYVGANDGMLHGFRAGQDTPIIANGVVTGSTFSNTDNDGVEVLAYVPSLALKTIHSVVDATATTNPLDYSDPTYAHNAFVDATPGVGDLFYGGAWHTWLVGGLGAGGNGGGIYACRFRGSGRPYVRPRQRPHQAGRFPRLCRLRWVLLR